MTKLKLVTTKVESGALPEFADFEDEFTQVSHKLQKRWLKLYPDHKAMMREIAKAIVWDLSQDQQKKNISLFITNWLNRSKELSAATEAWFRREQEKIDIQLAKEQFVETSPAKANNWFRDNVMPDMLKKAGEDK